MNENETQESSRTCYFSNEDTHAQIRTKIIKLIRGYKAVGDRYRWWMWDSTKRNNLKRRYHRGKSWVWRLYD